MSVLDLLSAFDTSNILIELWDAGEQTEPIIKFYSEGYLGVESDILARDVDKFDFVVGKSSSEPTRMNIYLSDVEITEPTEEPVIGD